MKVSCQIWRRVGQVAGAHDEGCIVLAEGPLQGGKVMSMYVTIPLFALAGHGGGDQAFRGARRGEGVQVS